MDLWDQGRWPALVDDTENEVLSKDSSSRSPDNDSQAHSFHARVLSGRLRSAVRTLTGWAGGGVLHRDDKCTKTGRPVWEVLQEKHPALREPPSVGQDDGAFVPYPLLSRPPSPSPSLRMTWKQSLPAFLERPVQVVRTRSILQIGSSDSEKNPKLFVRRWQPGSIG